MPKNPNWTRQRVCTECGRKDAVRKDNSSTRCRPCANALKAKAWWDARPREPKLKKAREFRRVARTCKACGGGFSVPRSVAEGKTNASGNFCGLSCYHLWLRRTPGPKSNRRGSGWKGKRDRIVRAAPFCAICGTGRRLDVHHIVPWRISRDNRDRNLIPLCKGHHKAIELATVEIEAFCGPEEVVQALEAMRYLLRIRQAATAAFLMRLKHDL